MDWITIEIVEALGSTPRDQGTRMFVSEDAMEGSIGGGALEFRAIDRARLMLAEEQQQADMELPLGPALNQCCGGFVKLRLTAGRHEAPATSGFPLIIYGGGLDERDSTPADQASLVRHAERSERGALHYIMTHDHQLDLEIVSTLLSRSELEVPFVGMIGSQSKIARFRSQLSTKGFSEDQQKRLVTPIGIAGIGGKEPAVIAASVAAEALLLRSRFLA